MERVGEVLGRVLEDNEGHKFATGTDVPLEINFSLPVKFADECRTCTACGEPYCDECQMHYADCAHPGPHSEPEEE